MIITEMDTLERLEDYEIRSEYGSATLKYDIAAAIVAARKMKNLTQAVLANIAGVSQAYIAKLESGEANPTISRVGAILAAIWLKAEINLAPLMPILDSEIAKQRDANQGTDTAVSSSSMTEYQEWIKMQQSLQPQQFSFNIIIPENANISIFRPEMMYSGPMVVYASRTPSAMGATKGSYLTQQGNIFTSSNDVLTL